MRYLLSLLVIAWTVVSAALNAAGVWHLPLLAVILPAIIWFGGALVIAFIIAVIAIIAAIVLAVKARRQVRDPFRSFGRI